MNKLRQPKAGDVWLCDEGAVLVFAVSATDVDYLWQDTPDKFEFDGRNLEAWHKYFGYQYNVFDYDDELKEALPADYQEVKAQQAVFEHLAAKKPKDDPINRPSHYTSDPSGVECISIAEHHNFNIGNAIKYLWRAGLKEGNSSSQDLQKAVWYINREIGRIELNPPPSTQ